MLTVRLLSLFLPAMLVPCCMSYVRLIFPPARNPSLDFLDNFHTPAPCGVPKPRHGQGNYTVLPVGSKFNITWFQARNHQGGFRIELLNELDKVAHVLTPHWLSWTGSEDSSTEKYEAQLPDDFECHNCTLRLLRQATELGNVEFWSCSDVHVLQGVNASCSSNGKFINGHCVCNWLYSGQACQLRDDCATDFDCNNNGICQELDQSAHPRRVCYCNPGWFGRYCNKSSPINSKEFDSKLYTRKDIGKGEDKIFWRILQESNELEMILRYKTNSWMAVGWKPNGFSDQCQKMWKLEEESEEATTAANSLAETEPETEVAAQTTSAETQTTIDIYRTPTSSTMDTSSGIVPSAEPEPRPTVNSSSKERPQSETAAVLKEPKATLAAKEVVKLTALSTENQFSSTTAQPVSQIVSKSNYSPQPETATLSVATVSTSFVKYRQDTIDPDSGTNQTAEDLESWINRIFGPDGKLITPPPFIPEASEVQTNSRHVQSTQLPRATVAPPSAISIERHQNLLLSEAISDTPNTAGRSSVGEAPTSVLLTPSRSTPELPETAGKWTTKEAAASEQPDFAYETLFTETLPGLDLKQQSLDASSSFVTANPGRNQSTSVSQQLRLDPELPPPLDPVELTTANILKGVPLIEEAILEEYPQTETSEARNVSLSSIPPSVVQELLLNAASTTAGQLNTAAIADNDATAVINSSSVQASTTTISNIAQNMNATETTTTTLASTTAADSVSIVTDTVRVASSPVFETDAAIVQPVQQQSETPLDIIPATKQLVRVLKTTSTSSKTLRYTTTQSADNNGDGEDVVPSKLGALGLGSLRPFARSRAIGIIPQNNNSLQQLSPAVNSELSAVAPELLRHRSGEQETIQPSPETFQSRSPPSAGLATGIPAVAPPPPPPPQPDDAYSYDVARVEGEACYGEWKWPPQCVDSQNPSLGRRTCDYRASWAYRDETDDIEFSIQASGANNWWTGIGFSKTGSMLDTDMVIVSTKSGVVQAQDYHSNGYQEPPTLDEKQDVKVEGGSHVNGVIRVGFVRPRQTDDKTNDVQFSDNDCFYLLFPVSGGRVVDGQIGKHTETPKNSTVPICIKSCGRPKVTNHQCMTDYKYPPGCTPPQCDYRATWRYNARQELLEFEITSRSIGRWTGIGFSKDGNMTNSDVIIGWMYDDKPVVSDRFAYGKHQPAVDQDQNLEGISGHLLNEYQTIMFKRRIFTPDKTEDIQLDQCVHYLFPVGGGRILARMPSEFTDITSPIGYHDLYIPRLSKQPVCICNDNGEPITIKSPQKRSAEVSSLEIDFTSPTVRDEKDETVEAASHFLVVPTDGSPPRLAFIDQHGSLMAENTTRRWPKSQNLALSKTGRNEATKTGPADGAPFTEQPLVVTAQAAVTVALQPDDLNQEKFKQSLSFDDDSVDSETHTEAETEPVLNDDVSSNKTIESSEEDLLFGHLSTTPVPEVNDNVTASMTRTSTVESLETATDELFPEAEFKPATKHTSFGGHLHETEASAHDEELPNAMDCTDMVIGSVIGSQSRIDDYFTSSLTSPHLDSFYDGGEDSLTAAFGFEENGVTTIMFRKPLSQGNEVTDHSIVNSSMTLIWAKGNQALKHYPANVVKYHGKHNRGVLELNFFDLSASGSDLESVSANASASKLRNRKTNATATKSNHPLSDAATENLDDKELHTTVMNPGKYSIHLYMPEMQWSDELSDTKSRKFKELSRKLKADVAKMLAAKLHGFMGVVGIKFTNGSVHAYMDVEIDGHTALEIQNALVDELAQDDGIVGGTKVDSRTVEVKKTVAALSTSHAMHVKRATIESISLTKLPWYRPDLTVNHQVSITSARDFSSPTDSGNVDDDMVSDQLRNYVIIGVACCVTVISLIIAAILICRIKKRDSPAKTTTLYRSPTQIYAAPSMPLPIYGPPSSASVGSSPYAHFPAPCYYPYSIPMASAPARGDAKVTAAASPHHLVCDPYAPVSIPAAVLPTPVFSDNFGEDLSNDKDTKLAGKIGNKKSKNRENKSKSSCSDSGSKLSSFQLSSDDLGREVGDGESDGKNSISEKSAANGAAAAAQKNLCAGDAVSARKKTKENRELTLKA